MAKINCFKYTAFQNLDQRASEESIYYTLELTFFFSSDFLNSNDVQELSYDRKASAL